MTNVLAQMAEELALLTRVRTDPVWFAKNVLNLTGDKFYLDPWQEELMEACADIYRKQVGIPTVVNHDAKSMITVRAMHGPGKTFAVAAVMHWFNCAFRGRIICTAPKEKQLLTRLWPAFRKISVRAGKKYAEPVKVDSTKITWHKDEDWCALAETASAPENLAGYHDDYMLFIVDEASGVNEAMFPVIEGAVSTGTIVILLLIGNPTKNQGTFHASHCIPKVAKNYFQIFVDLAKTTRVSKEWVKRMEDKYGRNSPVVKVRCYGEFADGDEAQLIAYAWLTEALDREGIGEGELPRLRITCDVADGGANFTMVTAGWLYESGAVVVLKQKQYSFPSSESPILAGQAALKMFEAYGGNPANGDDLVIDSLGVGAGTAGYLLEKGLPVITYKGGEASDNPLAYRNRRTQSYIVCRDRHRDGKISYREDFLEDVDGNGDWDDFTAQMCSVRTKPGSERMEELETKESMRMRGVTSPDRADGIAMLFATQAPSVAGMLQVIPITTMQSAERNW
jgi:hypothetical protein